MNDSNDSIDPVSGPLQPTEAPAMPPPSVSFENVMNEKMDVVENKDSGQDHVIMGMHMNDDQYKQFMQNMQQSISTQLKQDKANMKQTQDQIKQEEQLDGG